MGIHETEALVLKSYPLAEADKIVVFLTRSHGIVRGVAKGAKRLNSKFGGSLEPFSTVRLEFFQSPERELVTIRGCEIVDSIFLRASEPVLLGKLSYFSEILTGFTPPSDPDDRLYRMTKLCLESAAALPEATDFLVAYFEIWVVRLAGFLPSWQACSRCGREFKESEDAALRADFRLACAGCERVRQQDRVSGGVRAVHLAAQKMPPAEFAAYAASAAAEVYDLSVILKRIISGVLGRETTAVRNLS